jgi:hypothetical protein
VEAGPLQRDVGELLVREAAAQAAAAAHFSSEVVRGCDVRARRCSWDRKGSDEKTTGKSGENAKSYTHTGRNLSISIQENSR